MRFFREATESQIKYYEHNYERIQETLKQQQENIIEEALTKKTIM